MPEYSKPADGLSESSGFHSDGQNFTLATSSEKAALVINDKTAGVEIPGCLKVKEIDCPGLLDSLNQQIETLQKRIVILEEKTSRLSIFKYENELFLKRGESVESALKARQAFCYRLTALTGKDRDFCLIQLGRLTAYLAEMTDLEENRKNELLDEYLTLVETFETKNVEYKYFQTYIILLRLISPPDMSKRSTLESKIHNLLMDANRFREKVEQFEEGGMLRIIARAYLYPGGGFHDRWYNVDKALKNLEKNNTEFGTTESGYIESGLELNSVFFENHLVRFKAKIQNAMSKNESDTLKDIEIELFDLIDRFEEILENKESEFRRPENIFCLNVAKDMVSALHEFLQNGSKDIIARFYSLPFVTR